jgi:hypothetical protein
MTSSLEQEMKDKLKFSMKVYDSALLPLLLLFSFVLFCYYFYWYCFVLIFCYLSILIVPHITISSTHPLLVLFSIHEHVSL